MPFDNKEECIMSKQYDLAMERIRACCLMRKIITDPDYREAEPYGAR